MLVISIKIIEYGFECTNLPLIFAPSLSRCVRFFHNTTLEKERKQERGKETTAATHDDLLYCNASTVLYAMNTSMQQRRFKLHS